MRRTGERFGAAHIVDVLEGKASDKAASLGHDRLPLFGIGKDRVRAEWQSLIRQLVAAQFLNLDVAGHGGLSIATKGRALLKGEEEFRYRRDMIRASPRKQRRERAAEAAELDPQRETVLQRPEGPALAIVAPAPGAALCDLLGPLADRHGRAPAPLPKWISRKCTASAPPSSKLSAKSFSPKSPPASRLPDVTGRGFLRL